MRQYQWEHEERGSWGLEEMRAEFRKRLYEQMEPQDMKHSKYIIGGICSDSLDLVVQEIAKDAMLINKMDETQAICHAFIEHCMPPATRSAEIVKALDALSDDNEFKDIEAKALIFNFLRFAGHGHVADAWDRVFQRMEKGDF